jgi:hypothetical protein
MIVGELVFLLMQAGPEDPVELWSTEDGSHLVVYDKDHPAHSSAPRTIKLSIPIVRRSRNVRNDVMITAITLALIFGLFLGVVLVKSR